MLPEEATAASIASPAAQMRRSKRRISATTSAAISDSGIFGVAGLPHFVLW
ncbi:hypothetical protein ABZ807_07665 [Micromonospora sp. NPDC047548]|uniref:hypothetical protein n=1 Tax=Micromonospora sp. NPDC047548 TaxID=3155624 RepID=UPI0033C6F190